MDAPSPPWPSPVEARLSKTAIAVACQLFGDDGLVTALTVQSIHMHGAKQEVTSLMRDHGYVPRNRWEPDNGASHSARVFARRDV